MMLSIVGVRSNGRTMRFGTRERLTDAVNCARTYRREFPRLPAVEVRLPNEQAILRLRP